MDPITIAALIALTSTLIQSGLKLAEILNQQEGLTEPQKQALRDAAAQLSAATEALTPIPEPPE